MPLPSPYAPGELPRVLGGRRVELARVAERLARVAEHAEMSPPLVLHAPRGLGKTSLLREAERVAAEGGFVTVWVSCPKGSRVLPEIAAATAKALAEADLPRTGRRSRALLSQVGVDLGVPGLTVRADFDVPAEAGPTADQAPAAALRTLLGEAARLVRSGGGAGLLLVLDELHAAPFTELGVVLNVLQDLSGRRAEHPLAVLGAGLPSIPETLSRAATFGERTRFLTLHRLERADASVALIEPAEALGVHWDARALEAALTEADGFPYDLQLVGECSWAAARPVEGSRLTPDHVRAGASEMEEQRRAMCRARYESASEQERRFLRAMAETDEPPARRLDIARRMQRESQAISVPRARLIDEGVIEPVGRGLLRFTLPGMAAWIRNEVGTLSEGS